MTKQGKQVRSREANKVKNKLPQVTSLANQVAHLGSLVAKLNANSATSAQIQQLISIMTQLNASAVLSPQASVSVPEFQAPATGENTVPTGQLVQQAEQVMLALPDSLQDAISGLSERVAELDFSAASQTVQVELAALAEQVPSLFNAISVAPAVTAATNASKQSQSAIDAQQQFCLDAASLGQALPEFASNLDLAALPKQLLETGNLLSNIEFAEVLKGEFGSLTEAAPALLTQFGFDDAANVVTQFAPAVNQLDIPALIQGDLQSLQQALPSLLEAVDLKALNQTLAQEIPALAQLDLAGLANGELGSLAATLPNLLEAAGLDGAANSVSAALPALQQLDLGAIADGDIQSLLQSAPALLDALDMQGASQAFGSVLPIAEKLDFKGLMDGELSSLVDAAPEVLRAFELGDAADKLQAAVPGLKQLNLKQIASGDVSSLMAAGPSLLKAFELDGAAGVLEGALPALEKLDVDAILGGDIKSLVSAGPELLNAFGLNDAASVLEQHADLLSNIDLKGVLKGDLSSLTNSLPDLFGEFGLDGISDDLSESFAELESDVEEKKSTRKKGRKKRGRKRNKRARSSNLADQQEASADREHKPRKIHKRSANKPALKLLDGGKDPSVKAQLANQASQPKSKAKAKKVKMMTAANDASYQKLGSFSPAKGGKLGQLFKGSKKLLGRAAAPLSVALGAFDAFTALTDDTLTTKEKTTQVGAAAGGAGGALAGAAAGAAIGSVIPVVGTAIGGLVGGALGAMGGESIGGWFGDKLGGWFSDDAQDSASGTSSPSVTDRLLDSATSFATMGPLGLISDTLGGWLSKGDEHVAQTDNKTAAISTPQHGEATKNNALDFVKNNVINELNLATGTAAAFAANQEVTTSKIHGVSKAGDLAGRALNAHTVWETLNNDGLSVKEKAAGIGSTLGGMFSADAVSGALSKSKNPYVRMAAPMAGYLTNNMVGDAIKGWFSDDKTSATNEAKAPDPNSLNQLNVSANKASEHSSAPQPGAASVTVNANITVNANDGQQAYEVAQQVKQMLDQQQQQAEQELSARYYNQVA